VVNRLVIVTAGATSGAVKLAGDGVGDVRQLLLLLLKVLRFSGGSVLLEPLVGLLDSVQDSLLVLLVNLATKTVLIVDLVLQVESVVLETVTSLNALTVALSSSAYFSAS